MAFIPLKPIPMKDRISMIFVEYGQIDEAEKLLLNNLLFRPDDINTWKILAGVYLETKQPEKALRVWDKIIRDFKMEKQFLSLRRRLWQRRVEYHGRWRGNC